MDQTTISNGKLRADVTMFGGFEITVNGKTLNDNVNRSHKLWELLSYLIINRKRNISRVELIEQFWADESQSNPVNALKTLLHRIRATLEPLFGGDVNPILSHVGICSWNPEIECTLDIEIVQELYDRTLQPEISEDEKLECYERIFNLYKGDLLPKLHDHLWVISLQAYYHSIYVSMIKSYAAILESREQYQEMSAVCTRATQIESLDEDIYYLLISALIKLGETTAALNQYNAVVEHLYRSFGIRPSARLRGLYDTIMNLNRPPESDIDLVEADLREVASQSGAYFCEYDFFRAAYQVDSRRMQRGGICVHIAMLTLSSNGKTTVIPAVWDDMMKIAQKAIIKSLRVGDIVSRYSEKQFIVLLHASNYENSIMVLERIVTAFQKSGGRKQFKLDYAIRELDFTGN